jgi:hypothetical protein
MVRCRARPAYKLQRTGGNCKGGTQGTFIYQAGTRFRIYWLLLVDISQSSLLSGEGVSTAGLALRTPGTSYNCKYFHKDKQYFER